jgi:hypothetical protein
MLTKEEWLLIWDLHSKAFNISEIARVTGYARETVRKYLNLETAPEPQKRPTRSSKLNPYKPYMLKKLNEGPYSTAYLLREIQEMGFDGRITIVKDFVRKIRPKKECMLYSAARDNLKQPSNKKGHFQSKRQPCKALFLLNPQKSRVFYFSFLTNVFWGD